MKSTCISVSISRRYLQSQIAALHPDPGRPRAPELSASTKRGCHGCNTGGRALRLGTNREEPLFGSDEIEHGVEILDRLALPVDFLVGAEVCFSSDPKKDGSQADRRGTREL